MPGAESGSGSDGPEVRLTMAGGMALWSARNERLAFWVLMQVQVPTSVLFRVRNLIEVGC